MKIILIEDIDRIGRMGDVILVKDGYARNYLIPKKKARPATPENLKMAEALKKKAKDAEEKTKSDAKALADKISNLSLTVSAQAGEEEKLYGSVTADMIAAALEADGIKIDKKDIIIDEPIKKLGVYQVTVKIHPEMKVTLRVWVVKE